MMATYSISNGYFVDKDGNRAELPAPKIEQPVNFKMEMRNVKPFDPTQPEWPPFTGEFKIPADEVDRIFAPVKRQWILKIGNVDLNTLTDNQKMEISNRPFNIAVNDEIVYHFWIVGIHDSGGLLLELREDRT